MSSVTGGYASVAARRVCPARSRDVAL